MPQSSAALNITDLKVGYGKKQVCGVISFKVSGEALALVGPNGAGKSTALRTVVGQLDPLAGKVLLNKSAIDDRSADFRRLAALVFDDDAFFPELTVGEHLTMVAAGHGVSDPVAAVDQELDFFQLTEHDHSLVTSLSSGQRRRLLLASAFVRPRSLLVLDEPEQRLDTHMRRALAARVAQCAKQGQTVLLVTHDPEFLVTASRKALYIADVVEKLSAQQAAERIQAMPA
ncbi:ABC-type multidrug transport system ATPase subunit [Psychromicrobium silvestre]|uniref:ABC-type multidrug transport system ATPase subunit n=1 Tax=Psychromicrobium silvestre TaxID=1645614 RepID=A0A7Y9S858_9MICC|nr:ABC transporter ATP-binding protein [Psychromicrobium silvestre]NYE96155.1 ABC-type multidrug transport system ATPase subunit [Psychromicrobium silvestre]